MARPRLNPRYKMEPELASAIIYYDKKEFTSFYNLWQSIDSDDADMVSSGQFSTFMGYMKDIHNDIDEEEEILSEYIVTKLRSANDLEPSRIKREQFELWMSEVQEKDNPANFSLSEDLFDKYCWLCYKDKIDRADRSNMPFRDKLSIKPFNLDISSERPTYSKISGISNSREGKMSYTTGISILDDFVKPFVTNLLIIAARPGVGKSVFMLQQALENASKGIPSLFISLEMTDIQIKARIMNWYKNRKTNSSEWDKIEKEEAFQTLDNNLFILSNKSNNGNIIIEFAEKMIEENDIQIVFVDYLQLIRYPESDEWGSLRKATFDLKTLGVNYNALVVSCSQVLRKSTTYGLELESLFGSSTIENDADIVIGMEVAGRDKIDNSDEEIIYLKILKNREGLSGKKIKMMVKYITMKFVEV